MSRRRRNKRNKSQKDRLVPISSNQESTNEHKPIVEAHNEALLTHEKTLFQKIIEIPNITQKRLAGIVFLSACIVLVGGYLDAYQNALTLIKPGLTYYGSICLLSLLIVIHIILPYFRVDWLNKPSEPSSIYQLKTKTIITLAALAVFIILWVPRIHEYFSGAEEKRITESISEPIGEVSEVKFKVASDEILILIADIKNDDQERIGATTILLTGLKEATTRYPNVVIRKIDQAVTSSEVARRICKEQFARMIIWGSVVMTRENVRFDAHIELLEESLTSPLFYADETLTMAIAKIQDFVIQDQLSSKFSYLTLTALALIKFEAQDYKGVIEDVTAILNRKFNAKPKASPFYVYMLRGHSYLDMNDFKNAISDYKMAIQLEPGSIEAYGNLGIAYAFSGDYGNALINYNKAISIRPGHNPYYHNRGHAYDKLGLRDKAIEDFKKNVDLHPDNEEAHYELAIAYLKIGDLQQAKNDLNEAIRIKPDYVKAYPDLCFVLSELGELNQAIDNCSKAIELDPNLASAYMNRGHAYFKLNRFAATIEDYTKTIELNPKLSDAYNHLGLVYYKLGNNPKALEYYSQAIQINPKDYAAHFNLGELYFDNNMLQEAIKKYTEAIDIMPRAVDAYHRRGHANEESGNLHMALEDFNAALKINPREAEIYIDRGNIFKKLSDVGRAIEEYNNSLKFTDDPKIVQMAKGEIRKLNDEGLTIKLPDKRRSPVFK
jgi:tetratricopeptide (TPR) repeat protein